MIWREAKYHVSDCYFCLFGFSKNSKHAVKCAKVSSVTKPPISTLNKEEKNAWLAFVQVTESFWQK